MRASEECRSGGTWDVVVGSTSASRSINQYPALEPLDNPVVEVDLVVAFLDAVRFTWVGHQFGWDAVAAQAAEEVDTLGNGTRSSFSPWTIRTGCRRI